MIAQRLEQAMRERGWDQKELARRVGATQGAISKILVGRTSNSRLMPKIAAQLNKPLPYLLGAIDDDAVDVADQAFAPEEIEWLDLLRGLQREEREAVITLTRSLAHSSRTGTVHEKGLEYRAPPVETKRPIAQVMGFWDAKLARNAGNAGEGRQDGGADRAAGGTDGKV